MKKHHQIEFRHIHFTELTSTNDEAMNGEYAHGTVITADTQTAGRGQRGNRWESHSAENLMLSMVLKPHHIPVVEQYRISMMAALAASDAIRQSGINCVIKWPNDLYVGNRKIGGILIEHTLMGEMLTKSVVGVGINVNQTDFPDNLPNPTSMANEGVSNYSPKELLKQFTNYFEDRYNQTTEELHKDYMDRLWRSSGSYHFADQNGEFTAHIATVDPLTGRLTLALESGDTREYWFKEVEFMKDY